MSSMFALVGPTGTGKTDLSLDLAERIAQSPESAAQQRAEIVNADAMQLYRGMDIGTAKLPASERRGIPHHLFDVLEVTDESTVAAYQRDARAVITQIESRGGTPIIVGGSGLYVSAALFEFEFPGTDPEIRERLEAQADKDGIAKLLERLHALDPETAEAVDQNNPRRVIRALEIVELTGKPAQIGLPEQPVAWHPVSLVGLFDSRESLVARLDRRVEHMWQKGMLDEVSRLRALGLEHGVTARRAIGYAQALAQLSGEMTELEAIEQTKVLTRRYARRQMSWFKRYHGIRWFRAGTEDLVDRILDAADPGDPLEP
jgi:tRNA dimethylallyltransferase